MKPDYSNRKTYPEGTAEGVMPQLRTQLLFEIDIDLAPPQILDATPLGKRRIVPVPAAPLRGLR